LGSRLRAMRTIGDGRIRAHSDHTTNEKKHEKKSSQTRRYL
jgi:hypothetical protein